MTDTSYDAFDDEPPPALGIVLDQDRGSLPYALIHGEALVACAAWALGDAGVTPLDVGHHVGRRTTLRGTRRPARRALPDDAAPTSSPRA